jgi:hypothetical protein
LPGASSAGVSLARLTPALCWTRWSRPCTSTGPSAALPRLATGRAVVPPSQGRARHAPDCCATIKVRKRIASPKNVTQRGTVASSIMLLLPHPAGNVPKSSFPLKELAVCCGGPGGVVGDALASSKRSCSGAQ